MVKFLRVFKDCHRLFSSIRKYKLIKNSSEYNFFVRKITHIQKLNKTKIIMKKVVFVRIRLGNE